MDQLKRFLRKKSGRPENFIQLLLISNGIMKIKFMKSEFLGKILRSGEIGITMMTNIKQRAKLATIITGSRDLMIMSTDNKDHMTHIEMHIICKGLMLISIAIDKEVSTKTLTMIVVTTTTITTKRTTITLITIAIKESKPPIVTISRMLPKRSQIRAKIPTLELSYLKKKAMT